MILGQCMVVFDTLHLAMVLCFVSVCSHACAEQALYRLLVLGDQSSHSGPIHDTWHRDKHV